MEDHDNQVSHTDLYHKLGKLEGLIETLMTNISSFQSAIKDVHSRIDALESRQVSMERNFSISKGASNAVATMAKDFAVPIAAILVTWFVATNTLIKDEQIRIDQGNIRSTHTK